MHKVERREHFIDGKWVTAWYVGEKAYVWYIHPKKKQDKLFKEDKCK